MGEGRGTALLSGAHTIAPFVTAPLISKTTRPPLPPIRTTLRSALRPSLLQ